MNTLRWIAFLPTAFLASVIAGAIGHYLGGFAGAKFFDEGSWVSWLVSGVVSGFVFVLVGIKVAPEKTNGVKLTLAVFVMALGGISVVGSLFGGEDQTAALAGIAMVLVSIGIIRTPVQDLEIL